jgi:hypothetical protein
MGRVRMPNSMIQLEIAAIRARLKQVQADLADMRLKAQQAIEEAAAIQEMLMLSVARSRRLLERRDLSRPF